jgi:hypothetical protein
MVLIGTRGTSLEPHSDMIHYFGHRIVPSSELFYLDDGSAPACEQPREVRASLASCNVRSTTA